jgi:uncharacterized membrane protein YhaH (DUF805 family)
MLPVYMLIWLLIQAVTGAQQAGAEVDAKLTAASVEFFVTLYPYCAIYAKRFHDFDRSGWWCIPLMVSYFFVAMLTPQMGQATEDQGASAVMFLLCAAVVVVNFLLLGIVRGNATTNRFGPPPPK